MVSLEQMRLLEARIEKAIGVIKRLREENQALRGTLDASQARMDELEGLVAEFKADQREIEESVLRALKNLDELEDEVTTTEEPGEQPGTQEEQEGSSEPRDQGRSKNPGADQPGPEGGDGNRELEIF